ncbi:unnamed protein product [Ectocarpus sp. 12 AP-2014]
MRLLLPDIPWYTTFNLFKEVLPNPSGCLCMPAFSRMWTPGVLPTPIEPAAPGHEQLVHHSYPIALRILETQGVEHLQRLADKKSESAATFALRLRPAGPNLAPLALLDDGLEDCG